MTAEILLMNHNAVVLAADSAATLDKKVFLTDKIFRISETQPIGLMMYNNINIARVSVDQIAKTFRNKFGKRSFATIEECAKTFIDFLEHHYLSRLTDEDSQLFTKRMFDFAIKIAVSEPNNSDRTFETIIVEASKRNKIKDLLRKCENLKVEVEKQDLVEKMSVQYLAGFRHSVHAILQEIADTNGIKISNSTAKSISDLLISWITHKTRTRHHTGLVFCGYGEDEIHPSYTQITVDGSQRDSIRWWEQTSESISLNNRSAVNAFGQTGSVVQLITGMSSGVLEEIERNFGNMHQANQLVVKDENGTEVGLSNLNEVFRKARAKMFKEYTDNLAPMPKEELAVVAQAAIDLSSITKKMENDVDSVGGPTDVAIITKCDGFIWKKRKHYFDYEFNRHFGHKH